MDPHGAGQLKSNRCRVDNLLNNKQADGLEGQLLGLHPQWMVLAQEPHLLAQEVSGGPGTMAAGGCQVPVRGS